ncbi:MAG: type II toxin-antitoxin system HicA family toxin [Desulfovibrio sp.]
MESRKIIKIMKKAGWYQVAVKGDHHQFKHPEISGRATVPHPNKDIPIGTLKRIEQQTGLKFK